MLVVVFDGFCCGGSPGHDTPCAVNITSLVTARVRQGNIRLPGLLIPRDVAGGQGLQNCAETEVQLTEWYTLNPHFAAPRGFGVTDFFLPNTSIKGLLLRRCGEPVFTQGLARPVEIVLDIDQPQGVQPGYLVDHMCAVFDDGLFGRMAGCSDLTHEICQSSRSYGYFAALYRVVREVPPNTTSPPPPEIEEDTGLGLPAIIALVAGGAIFLGGAIGGIYAWHLARSKKPVEPEEEEEEEVVEESESESEVKELPDPDPALTKLRQAAEAGTLTAREILARHSGPTGIRQELVWALDKGYENKRREAARMKAMANEAEWKECFDLFDKAAELGEALRSLGLVLTQKELSDMKAEVGGDLISWEKFKGLVAKKPKAPEKQAQALMQAFQVFDPSGSGHVDMKELRHIVTSLGEKLTPQEFEDICKAAGLPTSGSLAYKQVVDKVTKT
ncbi:unnamed protein product [Cladocopium goreaui]|uniref:Calmodulin n=1 Tax=Cladocopium goreaui TaxID=2562237 RepID=A0A9P1CIT4_9DINO|nr:unnamed protein product [Cladocopium goreaui]